MMAFAKLIVKLHFNKKTVFITNTRRWKVSKLNVLFSS